MFCEMCSPDILHSAILYSFRSTSQMMANVCRISPMCFSAVALRLHSLCILQGEAEDFMGGSQIFRAKKKGGALKFLEQKKKGGYENCLNISGGDAYFL